MPPYPNIKSGMTFTALPSQDAQQQKLLCEMCPSGESSVACCMVCGQAWLSLHAVMSYVTQHMLSIAACAECMSRALQRCQQSGLLVCRSFGCSAPVGTVYSINPAMIMTLVPLVGAAATQYSHFDMIHYGSYVSALSPVWMALFTTGKSN